jgi:heat-inducible transcriptional repressor
LEELTERRKKILQLVVDEYIDKVEPVSSKRVQQKHLQDLSTATIRSELAALEEMGFLEHPHTSAGKVPRPKAYRYYVEKLMQRRRLTEGEIDYIQNQFNANIGSAETLIKNAAKVISDITNYAGFGIENIEADERIENIKLVPISEKTTLLIVVTETKILKDSIIETNIPLNDVYIESGAEILRGIFCGKKIKEAVKVELDIITAEFNRYRQFIENLLRVLKEYISGGDKVFAEGTVKVLSNPEFSDIDKAKKFLSLIESREKLTSMLQNGCGDFEFTVKIGPEGSEDYKDFSLVSANYSVNGKTLGFNGVLGPIRMDYRKIISVLECIKSTIDELLK